MRDPDRIGAVMRNLSLPVILPLLAGGLLSCASTVWCGDRRPAVAGQFYPGNKGELSRLVRECFRQSEGKRRVRDPRALIVPHAGFVFSGEVAAAGFSSIDPAAEYEAIFLLGPSHRVGFQGAAVYVSGDFQTPLGRVPVHRKIGRQLLSGGKPFVERDDAHAEEHSLEVQLPFLQERLSHLPPIVPIVIGSCPPDVRRSIADRLKPFLGPKVLFVISTDFSHYPPADDAGKADSACAGAIATNSLAGLLATVEEVERRGTPGLVTAMCGFAPVSVLLAMTEGLEGSQYSSIEHRTSADSRYGNGNETVGYWSIALTAEESRRGFTLGEADRQVLKRIAREAINGAVRTGRPPAIDPATLTVALRAGSGAFVTLHQGGDLRGCIGRFDASTPLWKTVQQMAVAAAQEDPRFAPVAEGELAGLTVEISVLTPLRRIRSIDEITLGVHGITIVKGGHSGTFLPQVATETGWTREEFLGHCSRDKAGLGWDGWRDAELFVYEAIVF